MATPHEILKISVNASPREIKSAYRKLAKLYHPDINKSQDAAKLFGLINTSFMQLTSPATHRTIENKPRQQASPPPRPDRKPIVKGGHKFYAMVENERIITIDTGCSKIPENSYLFLMWQGREYRVALETARLIPFAIQLNAPPVLVKCV